MSRGRLSAMQDSSAATPTAHPHALAASGKLSDQSLVRRAQSGERRAFDRLVLKNRSHIVELAMRYTRNRRCGGRNPGNVHSGVPKTSAFSL